MNILIINGVTIVIAANIFGGTEGHKKPYKKVQEEG